MKTSLLLGICIIFVQPAHADQAKKEALISSADILLRLEKTRTELFSNPPTYEILRRYEIELQKSAEEFGALSNRVQKFSPATSKSAYECSGVIVNSAFAIYKGFEAKASPGQILEVHSKYFAKLLNTYLQFISSFGTLKGKDAVLTHEEQVEIIAMILNRLKAIPNASTPSLLIETVGKLTDALIVN